MPAMDLPMSRSPFVPIVKHKSSMSPPSSPALGQENPFRVPSSSSSSTYQSDPLGPSTAHNLVPASSAPKIRAKITPAATPRKKQLLPGAGDPDLVVTPIARKVLPPTPGAANTTPQPRSVVTAFGNGGSPLKRIPALPTIEEPVGLSRRLEEATRGLAGLGLGTPFEQTTAATKAFGKYDSEPKTREKENVMVCVRVRPAAAKLAQDAGNAMSDAWDVDCGWGKVSLVNGPPATSHFVFDSVVTGSDNLGVYAEAGRDLVLSAMEGYDAVIFAYGQTASGKTFTLSGTQANPGIIPQAVSEIFNYIRRNKDQEFLLRASYLEIYNETLKDLLDPETAPKIRQDANKRFFVAPLREEVVTSEVQVAALLRRGEANRHVGSTDFNERSSRSHSVFQITIESTDDATATPSAHRPKTPSGSRLAPGSSGIVRMSKLSLIDLAGSEQATSQTERRNEGAFINKSLLTLEKVIASLTEDSKKRFHVPYRDSKLTQILQPSLSGDARVAVIATINPSTSAIEESKSTLKFAQRIKKVVLKAIRNEVVDEKALITVYRSRIAALEAELAQARSMPGTPRAPTATSTSEPSERKSASVAHIEELQNQMRDLRMCLVSSSNVEERRNSIMPPRPISPVKPRRGGGAGKVLSSPGQSSDWEQRYNEAIEDKKMLEEEVSDLKLTIQEMEDERIEAATKSSDERIAELLKENQELKIVSMNSNWETQLKRAERKFENRLEQCMKYEANLEARLREEQERSQKFERFILQHLTNQIEHLTAARRESTVAFGTSALGLQPIMSESPNLDAISPVFVELEDLNFSEEGRATVVRSQSRLLNI